MTENEAMDFVTVESIEADFPGWEAWQGVDRMWHARVRGATPPVMVHGEDLVDLRDQIKRRLARDQEYWHRPEGATLWAAAGLSATDTATVLLADPGPVVLPAHAKKASPRRDRPSGHCSLT